MSWKATGIIGIILLIVGLGIAIYMKIIQPTEGQKAKEIVNQNTTYDFHPVFGCMRIPQSGAKK